MRRAALWLHWASAVAALAAAGLLAYRLVPGPGAGAPPAVYTPVGPSPPRARGVVETERPASGFIVLVDTVPGGALLSVDGVERGPTPASLNLECAPGQRYALRLTLDGFATLNHSVVCKRDVMLMVSASLKKK